MTTDLPDLRELPDLPVVGRQQILREGQVDPWCAGAFRELRATLEERAIPAAGPPGLTLSAHLAAADGGLVRAFVPVPAEHAESIVAGRLVAVAVHEGHLRAVEQTARRVMAQLATAATGEGVELDAAGERRETYLVGPGSGRPMSRWLTEVALPVRRTT